MSKLGLCAHVHGLQKFTGKADQDMCIGLVPDGKLGF